MSRSIVLALSTLAIAGWLPAQSHAGGAPAADAEVAVIGAQRLTYAQMPPSTQDDLERSERQYQDRLRQQAIDHRREQQSILEQHANDLLDSKLMQAEAAARHTTVEQLIREVKNPEVTEADIHAFYDQHRQQIKEPFAQAMIPITQFLMQQAAEQGKRTYLAGLRAKYGGRLTLEPLRDTVAADGPSLGPDAAVVTIVEFADFQCPYCAKMAPVLQQVLEKYPHDVRLVYRQLPLSEIHPLAMGAAQASVCAKEQGKFWPMHDALFADQKSLDDAGLRKTAERLQLDTATFEACLKSPATATAIKADMDAGAALGVNGTPGLFVNGRFLNGSQTYERLAAVIDDELVRRGRRAAPVASAGASTMAAGARRVD